MSSILFTTYNKRLYDEYAHQLIKTYADTNQKLHLYVFVEDNVTLYPAVKNVTYLDLFQHEPDLKKFIERNKHKPTDSFFKDAVRFSYKVFAQNAAREYADRMFFVDADMVFNKQIPLEVYDTILPKDIFVGFYDRPNQYTETGFIGFNNDKLISKKFFGHYLNLYKEDTIYNLENWTDCHAFDETRKNMMDDIHYSEIKWGDGEGGHIMARDKVMNPYIDHRKGKRKLEEHSPEWRNNQ
jgi:hypothetical protein